MIEHLALFAGYYERPREVDEVIELVGLEEKRDARVRTLSGGQQRRLDLGLGLIGDPEMLFLDEPTTGFDPAARRAAWETIRSLRDARQDDPADDALPRRGASSSPTASPCCARARSSRSARPSELTGAGAGDRDPLPARTAGGGRRRTEEPTRVLHELTGAGARRGRELEGLEVRRPTLEEIYLSLTGRGARVRLFRHEFRVEQKLFWRSRELAFFTFLLPIIFFVLLGSVYGDDEGRRSTA